MAHQTLRIHRFADTWLSKPYKYDWFPCFSCFICFPCFPCFLSFYGFQCFSNFQCVHYSGFPLTAFPGSMAGARLTAFPEVRFMRCALHGSNLNRMRVPAELSEKPRYQRSPATRGGLGYNPWRKHRPNLSTTGLSHRQNFRPTAPALAPAG